MIQLKASQANKTEDIDWVNHQLLYYQTRCNSAEKSNIHLQKSLNKISGYLANIGLSIEALKESWKSGTIKFGKFNQNIFKIEWIWHRAKPGFKLSKTLKRISEEPETA